MCSSCAFILELIPIYPSRPRSFIPRYLPPSPSLHTRIYGCRHLFVAATRRGVLRALRRYSNLARVSMHKRLRTTQQRRTEARFMASPHHDPRTPCFNIHHPCAPHNSLSRPDSLPTFGFTSRHVSVAHILLSFMSKDPCALHLPAPHAQNDDNAKQNDDRNDRASPSGIWNQPSGLKC